MYFELGRKCPDCESRMTIKRGKKFVCGYCGLNLNSNSVKSEEEKP